MTKELALRKASNYGLYLEVKAFIDSGYDPEEVLEIFDLD